MWYMTKWDGWQNKVSHHKHHTASTGLPSSHTCHVSPRLVMHTHLVIYLMYSKKRFWFRPGHPLPLLRGFQQWTEVSMSTMICSYAVIYATKYDAMWIFATIRIRINFLSYLSYSNIAYVSDRITLSCPFFLLLTHQLWGQNVDFLSNIRCHNEIICYSHQLKIKVLIQMHSLAYITIC